MAMRAPRRHHVLGPIIAAERLNLAARCACLILASLAGAGCGNSSDAAIEQAISGLDPSAVTQDVVVAWAWNVHGKDVNANRERLSKYDPADLLRVAQKVYSDSADADRRARALSALYLAPLPGGPEAVRVRADVVRLALKALSDKEALVQVMALCVLCGTSQGGQEETRAVVAALAATENERVMAFGYEALARWGAWDTILADVERDCPPGADAAQVKRWRKRTYWAVDCCRRRGGWRGPSIPERLGERVLHLAESHPELSGISTRFLIWSEASPMLPQMKAAYDRLPPGVAKAMLGTAIFALDANGGVSGEDLVRLQEGLLKEYLAHEGGACAYELKQFHTRAFEDAVSARDMALLEELWRGTKVIGPSLRGDMLLGVLTLLFDESTVLPFVAEVPDADMVQMLSASSEVRKTVERFFLDVPDGPMLMHRDHPDREATDERIRRLVKQAEAAAGP